MRISDWSSDVCSSDLREDPGKEKESDCSAGARLSNGGLLAVSSVRSRHRSVSLGALGRTAPVQRPVGSVGIGPRSEEHTSELQSLMRISYAVFCLKKKKR